MWNSVFVSILQDSTTYLFPHDISGLHDAARRQAMVSGQQDGLFQCHTQSAAVQKGKNKVKLKNSLSICISIRSESHCGNESCWICSFFSAKTWRFQTSSKLHNRFINGERIYTLFDSIFTHSLRDFMTTKQSLQQMETESDLRLRQTSTENKSPPRPKQWDTSRYDESLAECLAVHWISLHIFCSSWHLASAIGSLLLHLRCFPSKIPPPAANVIHSQRSCSIRRITPPDLCFRPWSERED